MIHPVHRMAEQPDQEAHGEFRHDAEDVDVHRHVHQRQHQEQLRDRQPRHRQQQDRDDSRGDHEDRVEDVVGGDHPGALVRLGARLDQRIQRHDVEAAEHADAEDVAEHRPGLRLLQHRQPVVGLRAAREVAGVPPEQQAEQGQADGAERHQADLHLLAGELLAEHRTQRDAHREHREDQRHHALVAVQQLLGVARDLRQVDRTEEPEPGVAHQRARHRRALAEAHAQDRPGLGEDVPLQLQPRQRRRRAGNAAAGQVAAGRHQHHDDGHAEGMVLARHQQAGADGAEQDGEEGAHLHQRVAADQFVLVQRLRQDRVLHRAEQRRVGAHGEQRDEQQGQAAEQETGGADQHDHHLGQLQPAHQRVLVVFLAELPAEGGEQEERQDEQQRAEVHQQVGVAADRQVVEDRQHQRLLEQVVVERAEELGGEERQETLFAQQGELRMSSHRPCVPAKGSGYRNRFDRNRRPAGHKVRLRSPDPSAATSRNPGSPLP
ncbi:hypothetical protein D9M71_197300 [compost metagenome]